MLTPINLKKIILGRTTLESMRKRDTTLLIINSSKFQPTVKEKKKKPKLLLKNLDILENYMRRK